jgi:4-amino-4-deoxy-L-arabinose transferase-like glycosyltransferase
MRIDLNAHACHRAWGLRLFLSMERAGLDETAQAAQINRTNTAATIGGDAAALDATATTSTGRRWAIIVLTLAAILFFARLGVRALWSSEFRWAEIAREMLLTHNYFWPTINGRVYFDKPLGSYWLVVASTYLTGGMNEAAARLPCAVAGILAVALLILLTRRLYDLRTGVIAAFILATSFSFVFFSRHASADVETITGELAALVLFMRYEDRSGGWWVVGLWLIMAVTSLTKGLLGFVLPVIVIGSYSCLADGRAELGQRLLSGPFAARIRWFVERNRWFFNWHTVVALVFAAAVYYVPFAISHTKTGSTKGLYMVYRENIERYFEPFDHRGPIYLYLYVIFALMAPWSVFLPAALIQAHHRRRIGADHARSDRFILAFFWATFIFFTLSGSRRSYYLLPILPAAAMLIARTLAEPLPELTVWARRLVVIGYAVIVIAVAVSSLAFIPPHRFLPRPYAFLPLAPEQPVFAVFWIGSIIAIVYALRRFRSDRIIVSASAVAYLFMIYFFVFAMPAGDAWRTEKPFAFEVRQLIGGDSAKLAFFKSQGPVFYLGLSNPVPEYYKLLELDAAIKDRQVQWIVARRRDIDGLNVPTQVAASEVVYPWDPKEHRLNAMVLIRVTSSPK